MSEMEPDIRAFLMRIVQTISMGLLWMLLNATIGIEFKFAFWGDRPAWAHCIYYIFFLVSLAYLLLYFRKKWKDHL
jgi:hypothetical protein